MTDLVSRKRRVNGEIDTGQRVLVLTVEVAALGGLADAVEAVNFQVGRERQAGFKRVDPLAWVAGVIFDLSGSMRHAMRVVVTDLILVPGVAVGEEVVEALFDSQVAGRMRGIALFEVEEGAEADLLVRCVIGCPGFVAPVII